MSLVWLVGGVVVLGACASGTRPAGRTSSAPSNLSLGAQAFQNPSAFEKRALKDKKVTVAELLESTQVYEECLTSANITYQQGTPGDLGPSGVQTLIEVPSGVKDPDSYAATLNGKAQTCLAGVAAVEDVWVLQNQASQSDIDKAKHDFAACVERSGLTLPPDPSFAQAGQAAQALIEGASTTEVDPSSPRSQEINAVSACLVTITQSSQVALPGLAQALKSLNTSGW